MQDQVPTEFTIVHSLALLARSLESFPEVPRVGGLNPKSPSWKLQQWQAVSQPRSPTAPEMEAMELFVKTSGEPWHSD